VQLRRDVKPAWGLDHAEAAFFLDKRSPPDAWPIHILNDADQLGFLGWHSVDDRGRPFGRCFWRAAVAAGWPISRLMSHEAVESCVNSLLDRVIHGWPVEVCDPVEADHYTIGGLRAEDDERRDRPAVEVSSFVLPDWYDDATPPHRRTDFLG